MTNQKPYHCPHCSRLLGDVCDEGLVVNNTILIMSFVTFRCLFCKRLVKFRPSKSSKSS